MINIRKFIQEGNFSMRYWSYFLAIEKDLENISRFVEFSDENMKTHSIEFTRIFLSVSSEVDVILRLICKLLNPSDKTDNINDYQKIIMDNLSSFADEIITIPLYQIDIKPWDSWNEGKNPEWWKNHNKVKHERHIHFKNANLENTLSAVAALLVSLAYYYKLDVSKLINKDHTFKETTRLLKSNIEFIKLNKEYYYNTLIL